MLIQGERRMSGRDATDKRKDGDESGQRAQRPSPEQMEEA